MSATLLSDVVEVPLPPTNGVYNPQQVLADVRQEGKRIIGPRLRALRLAMHVDITIMADTVGLNKSTLQRWETKTEIAANHPVLPRLAAFLKVTPEELTADSNVPLLTTRSLGVIGYRTGKKFPPHGKRRPNGSLSTTPAAVSSRQWRKDHPTAKSKRPPSADPRLHNLELPITETRIMVATFNAQRMKGEKAITFPTDVMQALLANHLRQIGIDPIEVLVTRDFADIFHK